MPSSGRKVKGRVSPVVRGVDDEPRCTVGEGVERCCMSRGDPAGRHGTYIEAGSSREQQGGARQARRSRDMADRPENIEDIIAERTSVSYDGTQKES